MTVKGALFPARLLARNALTRAGLKSSQPKLFFIGFNKTGTKTLHSFFIDNGYLSVHSSSYMAQRLGLPPIAKLMQANQQKGLPLLAGLEHYDVFSDMIFLSGSEVIEANGWFRELDAQNPGAYFVFNDRPVEKWVTSRLSHEGGPRGSFVGRYASAVGIPEADVPGHWRSLYASRKAEALAYFAGNARFAVFDIEADRPEVLVRLLKADYRLDPALWSHRGSVAQRHGGAGA